MLHDRKLPAREFVFLISLQRHGFKIRLSKKNLKHKHAYIIPASSREDANGIDFWVKLPKLAHLIPVQITQRGTSLHKKYRHTADVREEDYSKRAIERLRKKRNRCKHQGVAFVLVRDYDGENSSTTIAWGDKKALMNGIKNWRLD